MRTDGCNGPLIWAREKEVSNIFISGPGTGTNQQNLSELSPVAGGLSSLEELRVTCIFVYLVRLRAHFPVTYTNTSHLRRAAPTAYGAAEIVSPSSEAIPAAAAATTAATAAKVAIGHRQR